MKLKYKLTKTREGVVCNSLRTAKQMLLENLRFLSENTKYLIEDQERAIADMWCILRNVSFVDDPKVNFKEIALETNRTFLDFKEVISYIDKTCDYLLFHNANYNIKQMKSVNIIAQLIHAINWQATVTKTI